MIVRFTRRAEADLVGIQNYLKRRSPEGSRVVGAERLPWDAADLCNPGSPCEMPNMQDLDGIFGYTIEDLVRIIRHDLDEDLRPSGRNAALRMAGDDLDDLAKPCA